MASKFCPQRHGRHGILPILFLKKGIERFSTPQWALVSWSLALAMLQRMSLEQQHCFMTMKNPYRAYRKAPSSTYPDLRTHLETPWWVPVSQWAWSVTFAYASVEMAVMEERSCLACNVPFHHCWRNPRFFALDCEWGPGSGVWADDRED